MIHGFFSSSSPQQLNLSSPPQSRAPWRTWNRHLRVASVPSTCWRWSPRGYKWGKQNVEKSSLIAACLEEHGKHTNFIATNYKSLLNHSLNLAFSFFFSTFIEFGRCPFIRASEWSLRETPRCAFLYAIMVTQSGCNKMVVKQHTGVLVVIDSGVGRYVIVSLV